jgi:hypothetical protein
MARRQKISQMTPKGANLQATDLLEISELSGTGYITKSITGQEIINAAGGGGSQNLQQVTDIGQTSTNGIAIIDSDPTYDEFTFVGFNYIEMQKQSTGELLYLTRDTIEIVKSGGANGRLKVSNVTNNVTLEFPDKPTGSYTIATTADIPSVSGFVPYTGATANVNLGTFDLDAAKGTFTHNGSTDTLTANHTSGSGIGLSITKGGANEGLKVNKTSGSGNAATIIGTLEATTIVKTGGTSSQFLMADGSTNTAVVPTTRNITINGTTQDLSADRTFSAVMLTGMPNIANVGVSGSLRYFGFSGLPIATSEVTRRIIICNNVTLKNFYVYTSTTQPATGSHVLTIFKNGVATAITITIPSGSGAGLFSDTTNSESFVQGDAISIQAVNNALVNSGVIVSFQIGTL